MTMAREILITMAPFSEILLLGAVLLFLLAILSVSRTVIRSVQCPITGRREVVHFQQAILGGRFLDVKRCGTFRLSSAITCNKTCLDSEPAKS